MSYDRWMCLVVSQPPDKMMIVGGHTSDTITSAGCNNIIVEECVAASK